MPSERGQSISVFVSVVIFALLLVAGLVIDGGRQSSAARRAELLASAAARAAVDATAPARAAGRAPEAGVAIRAARDHLDAAPDIDGDVRLTGDGTIRVTTTTRIATHFLSLIGISTLEAEGSAEAQLFSR